MGHTTQVRTVCGRVVLGKTGRSSYIELAKGHTHSAGPAHGNGSNVRWHGMAKALLADSH